MQSQFYAYPLGNTGLAPYSEGGMPFGKFSISDFYEFPPVDFFRLVLQTGYRRWFDEAAVFHRYYLEASLEGTRDRHASLTD